MNFPLKDLLQKKRFSVSVVLACLASIASAEQKPNIVLFVVDDMGLMDSSVPFLTDAAGAPEVHPLNELYRTPAMERLAAQGMRLSDFYAHTVCSPSRISIMTGQNSARHGTTNWINPQEINSARYGPREWNWHGLKEGDVTLSSLLDDAGYRTIFVGKAHFGPLDSFGADPLNLGFDVNIAGDVWGRPRSYFGRDHYGNHPRYLKTERGMTHHIQDLEAYYEDDVFLTEALSLEAQSAVKDSVEAEEPFFLMLSHYAVHTPFQIDPRFEANYAGLGLSNDATSFATLIEGIDKSLGDLMDLLDALGVAEETLIVFIGDNGTDAPLGDQNAIACSAPLRGKKGSKWEGGMRAPFIAAWARVDPSNSVQQTLTIPTGTIREELGTCYDLLPTFAAFADIEIPAEHTIDGQSLLPLLKGDAVDDWETMFLNHYPHEHRSSYFTTYRKDDWKLIRNDKPGTDKPAFYQLYNLKEDPSESHSQAEKNPQELARMISAMDATLEEMGALFPIKK